MRKLWFSSLLASFLPALAPLAMANMPMVNGACGMHPKLKYVERILECASRYGNSAEKKGWKLVVKTESGEEIWLSPSLKLWSALSHGFRTNRQVIQYDAQLNVVQETFCHSDLTWETRGYSNDQRWHIPSIDEFKAAEAEGFFESVPLAEMEVWSRDLSPENPEVAFTFQKDYFGKGFVGTMSRYSGTPERPHLLPIYTRCMADLTPQDLK